MTASLSLTIFGYRVGLIGLDVDITKLFGDEPEPPANKAIKGVSRWWMKAMGL